MKTFFPLLASLAAVSASAQPVTGLLPVRNANTAPRSTAVAATLSLPASPSANLIVLGSQSGGKKAGLTTRNGNSISFDPTVDFKPGETVMATLAGGGGASQVWQFTAAATGGNGVFSGGSDVLGATGSPADMATGDIDGDGDLDVVMGSYNAFSGLNGILVQLNNGLGAFTPGLSVALAAGVYSLKLGDVDNDGDLDVVYTDGRTQAIVVFNNGQGNFSGATSWATGPQNYGLVLGDIDADGDLDLATSNLNGNSVTIRRNDGTGNFAVSTTLNVQDAGWSLALGDADGDGDLDLWVPSFSDIYVLRNDGTGNFSPWQTLNLGFNFQPKQLELADLNNDGALDLLAGKDFTTRAPGPITAVIKVFLQDSPGTFLAAPDLTGVGGLFHVADLDGDGDLDIVTTTGTSANTACVRLNNGSGNFATGTDVALPYNSVRVTLGDLDGDGDVDLLARTSPQISLVGTAYPMAVRLNGTGVVSAVKAASSMAFSIWPNPTSPSRLCELKLTADGPATYTLRNALGQQLQHASFRNSTQVSLAGQAAGIYLLTVQVAGQTLRTERIVVE